MTDPFVAQRLRGNVLVVTGSTQGLGAAIARHAVRVGAAGIVVCGRDRERGEAVRDELAGLGCEAVFVAADLADETQCRAIVHACDERFGRLDGLVNAAGLSSRGTLDDIGWTATEREDAMQTGEGRPADWQAVADAGRPLGRLLRPDDIAPMVTYLLSDAARMVTGSVIDYDQTVHGPYGEHVARMAATLEATA
jgi:NAD(P)-dependent dehydrogenase (short-subunit alcohol dehydrogenase family)